MNCGTFSSTCLSDLMAVRKHNQVIDVSKWDYKTHHGAVLCTAPFPRGTLGYNLPQIPVVADDINQYISALLHLYGGNAEIEYAAEIEIVDRKLMAIEDADMREWRRKAIENGEIYAPY